MNNLVININITSHTPLPLYEDSTERAKLYAEKYGADFYSVTDCSRFLGYNPSWQRFIVFSEKFKKYDKILYVDADLLLLKGTPNIFELMDKYGQDFAASPDYQSIKARNDSGYFNGGLMCMGRAWLDLWDAQYIDNIMRKYQKVHCYDQCAFNEMVKNYKDSYLQLGRRWNTMNSDIKGIPGPVYGVHYIHYHKNRYLNYYPMVVEKERNPLPIIEDEKIFTFPEWYKNYNYCGILEMEKWYE